MQATNRGAWLPYKQARPLQVDDAPMPRPGPDEVIVKVHAVAINPADVAVQSLGIVYNDFPVIIGCDAAGEVIDLGTDVENYEKGDRVLVSVFKGAFQLYTTVKVPFAVKLPRSIACKDACVMGLGLATAMLHIFETDMLALRLPRVINPAPTDEVVLVWGGSSSVGSCAIQLAVAAGYDVVAIASERNFDYCRSIGASNCFDYKLGNAVSETAGALEGKKIAGSFCALASEEVLAECAQIVDRCSGNKVLSTVIPAFLPITIKIPDSVKLCQSKSLDFWS